MKIFSECIKEKKIKQGSVKGNAPGERGGGGVGEWLGEGDLEQRVEI